MLPEASTNGVDKVAVSFIEAQQISLDWFQEPRDDAAAPLRAV
jgi:hypothetical protein